MIEAAVLLLAVVAGAELFLLSRLHRRICKLETRRRPEPEAPSMPDIGLKMLFGKTVHQ